MKSSSRFKIATALHERIDKTVEPVAKLIQQISGDDVMHLTFQPGDGWCVCYNGGLNNAAIAFIDIDNIQNMSRSEFLDALDAASI